MMTTRQTNSIHLGLLLHNHQPVGNFPWVFQQVYEEAYLPLIQALERHPKVRLSLHYTGSLLDWLEEAHPEFIERIAKLVQRNQVEMVSGGYYEPILPSIPDRDKIAQIERLTERIQRDFGTRVTGMWIAERVWEPGLPRFLIEAGIEWTILDDVHFKSAGLDEKELYGYYATEDQSSIVKVYATSKLLRYTIPWRPVRETIENLRSLATPDGRRIAVMGDDGEKFGRWPETAPYCWGSNGHSGWIDEFFTELEQNSSWLQMTPLGEYAHNYPALGRIYIPTSAYIEMTEWALPPQKSFLFGKLLHRLEDERRDDILQFMRGGFWRNFLVRYHEINNQHNLYIDPQRGGSLFEWDMRRSMHNMLGVMTRHEESYHQALREYEQERRRREAAVAIESNAAQAYIQENTEPASPHTTVRTKEPDLDRRLVIDRYRRYSLIDHFLAPSVTLERFAQVHFEEQGNFVELPYETGVKQDESGITVTMIRDGQVKRPGALQPLQVRLAKTLFIPSGEEKLIARYTISNKGQSRLQTHFASEWNIHLLGGGGNDQAYYCVEGHEMENSHFDSTGEVLGVKHFHIGNRWIQQDMGFALSEAATLWRFSIETVTGSEAGFERNHQGSCLTLLWPILLEAEESWSVEITCTGNKV